MESMGGDDGTKKFWNFPELFDQNFWNHKLYEMIIPGRFSIRKTILDKKTIAFISKNQKLK